MFEDNKYKDSDLLMRSILNDAQEEVPAGVWEGIAEGLDKASRRKATVLVWRRTAVGFGIAAALAAGIVLNHGTDETLVPEAGEDMIAVVETPETDGAEGVMMAQVRERATPEHIGRTAKVSVPVRDIRMQEESVAAEEAVAEENVAEEIAAEEVAAEEMPAEEMPAAAEFPAVKESDLTYRYNEEYMPSEWEEEPEAERRQVGTSIVMSGIAGTNGTRNGNGQTGLLRQPSISTAPLKTGIKETSTRSVYGIPLSFGAGVKIDFTGKWSLGVGLNYTLLTRSFYGSYTKVNEAGSIEMTTQSDIRNTQHYVGIPVNAFYNIVDTGRLNFYTYAGGTVEKCVSDHYVLLGTDITHTEKAKGVQLSANIGLGVEFLLGKHLGLYIDPSLRYYFDTGQPKSIRTVQPLMLGFEMGLRVKL